MCAGPEVAATAEAAAPKVAADTAVAATEAATAAEAAGAAEAGLGFGGYGGAGGTIADFAGAAGAGAGAAEAGLGFGGYGGAGGTIADFAGAAGGAGGAGASPSFTELGVQTSGASPVSTSATQVGGWSSPQGGPLDGLPDPNLGLPDTLPPPVESTVPGAPAAPQGSLTEGITPQSVQTAEAALPQPGLDISSLPPGTTQIGKKLWDKITENPLQSASLAAMAARQIQAGKDGGLGADLKKLGQPATDVSNSLLTQYQNGQISPSAQFDIDTWRNQQVAAAKNYYAKAGMSDSDAARRAVSNIEAQATAMKDKARQGLLSSGLTAAGVGAGPVAAGINAQAQQDQALQASQSSALNSLMLLQAMQAKGGTPAA